VNEGHTTANTRHSPATQRGSKINKHNLLGRW